MFPCVRKIRLMDASQPRRRNPGAGKGCFIVAITAEDGCFLPVSVEDPVLVGVYDRRSGEELKEAVIVVTLKDYLKSL